MYFTREAFDVLIERLAIANLASETLQLLTMGIARPPQPQNSEHLLVMLDDAHPAVLARIETILAEVSSQFAQDVEFHFGVVKHAIRFLSVWTHYNHHRLERRAFAHMVNQGTLVGSFLPLMSTFIENEDVCTPLAFMLHKVFIGTCPSLYLPANEQQMKIISRDYARATFYSDAEDSLTMMVTAIRDNNFRQHPTLRETVYRSMAPYWPNIWNVLERRINALTFDRPRTGLDNVFQIVKQERCQGDLQFQAAALVKLNFAVIYEQMKNTRFAKTRDIIAAFMCKYDVKESVQKRYKEIQEIKETDPRLGRRLEREWHRDVILEHQEVMRNQASRIEGGTDTGTREQYMAKAELVVNQIMPMVEDTEGGDPIQGISELFYEVVAVNEAARSTANRKADNSDD